MRTFFSRSVVISIGILLVLSLFAARHTKSAVFFGSHDGELMLIRSHVAYRSFEEGVFPLRWSGTLNQFCGVPVFTFFYPLWHWIVGGLASLGVGSVPDLATSMYAITFVLSALFFFLWMKLETKNTVASFAGAVLYLFAPYRFLNVYVRGSIESLGFALLPLVFLSFNLYFRKPTAARLLFAVLSIAAFSLSHNLVFLMGIPFVGLYTVYWILKQKRLLPALLLGAVSILTVAFFWIPAIIEQPYTRLVLQKPTIEGNLVTIKQLLYSPWGYVYSAAPNPTTGPSGISLSVGISVIGGVFLSLLFLPSLRKFQREKANVITVLVILFTGLMWLITVHALFVWKAIPMLGIVQFPWRWIGILVFLGSVSTSLAIATIRQRTVALLIAIPLCALAFLSTRNYMRPNPVMEPDEFTNLDYHHYRYTSTGISDEIIAKDDPKACTSGEAIAVGKGISDAKRTVHETKGKITFTSNATEPKNITLALMYYPEIYSFNLNDKPVSYSQKQGRVEILEADVLQGENTISWTVGQTRLQKGSLTVSIATLGILIGAALLEVARLRKK